MEKIKGINPVIEILKSDTNIEKLEVYKKRRKINIIVINNGNSRSNDCWRGRNMH